MEHVVKVALGDIRLLLLSIIDLAFQDGDFHCGLFDGDGKGAEVVVMVVCLEPIIYGVGARIADGRHLPVAAVLGHAVEEFYRVAIRCDHIGGDGWNLPPPVIDQSARLLHLDLGEIALYHLEYLLLLAGIGALTSDGNNIFAGVQNPVGVPGIGVVGAFHQGLTVQGHDHRWRLDFAIVGANLRVKPDGSIRNAHGLDGKVNGQTGAVYHEGGTCCARVYVVFIGNRRLGTFPVVGIGHLRRGDGRAGISVGGFYGKGSGSPVTAIIGAGFHQHIRCLVAVGMSQSGAFGAAASGASLGGIAGGCVPIVLWAAGSTAEAAGGIAAIVIGVAVAAESAVIGDGSGVCVAGACQGEGGTGFDDQSAVIDELAVDGNVGAGLNGHSLAGGNGNGQVCRGSGCALGDVVGSVDLQNAILEGIGLFGGIGKDKAGGGTDKLLIPDDRANHSVARHDQRALGAVGGSNFPLMGITDIHVLVDHTTGNLDVRGSGEIAFVVIGRISAEDRANSAATHSDEGIAGKISSDRTAEHLQQVRFGRSQIILGRTGDACPCQGLLSGIHDAVFIGIEIDGGTTRHCSLGDQDRCAVGINTGAQADHIIRFSSLGGRGDCGKHGTYQGYRQEKAHKPSFHFRFSFTVSAVGAVLAHLRC